MIFKFIVWRKIELIEANFTSALNLLEKLRYNRFSTGIPSLDEVIGGIEFGGSYLFYSVDGGLADLLALKITISLLAQLNLNFSAILIACSDYRCDRTIIDTYLIGDLAKNIGLDPYECFNKIIILRGL